MIERYRAQTLPHDDTPAAWDEILPARTPEQKLAGERSADCVIIGAGFAGLAAAQRLHQLEPSAQIVILEAQRLAQGAAGRNSGFMIDLPHVLTSSNYAGDSERADRQTTVLNRQAIAFARACVEAYDIERDFFDECGKINGAVSEAAHRHNLEYAERLRALGEPSELLDQTQMHQITGSRYYRSGLHTPGTVTLQPAGYIRQLASGLIRHPSITLYEHSPVTQFVRTGASWQVTTPGGSVSTAKIILANNGHLESFGVERGHLMQVFLFASMTPALDASAQARLGGQPRWGVTPSDPMGTTMRRIDAPQGGHRIVTRTCAALRPNMRPLARDLARASAVQQKKFDQRFPQLAGMAMQYRWAGHLCLSRNGVSVVRELAEGVFSACVQNGLGTARGTLSGIAAAELACGQQSAITRYFAEQARPQKLPPQPWRELGANLLLRYREWRAKAD